MTEHSLGDRYRRTTRTDRLIAPAVCILAMIPCRSAPVLQPANGGTAWKAQAVSTHAKFTGSKGTFAQFGDSITDTMAFWTPLNYSAKNASRQMSKAIDLVKAYQLPECWREWKGPEHGNQSGQTTAWALKDIDNWLRRLNPEVAVVLFGTNDLGTIEAPEYAANLRTIVRKCADNGTVVILTTIPPRHDLDKKTADFAEAARRVARETGMPLVDFNAEILKRRPEDWDGALDRFAAFKDYDVPTLIARDGVHPSNPQKYQGDYSDQALRSNGYALRNYLTVLKYAEVIQAMAAGPQQKRDTSLLRPAGDLAGRSRGSGRSDPPDPSAMPAQTAKITLHPPSQPWFPKAPPLPAPTGETIQVRTVDELYSAAARVRPGGTILVADGFYDLPAPLELKTDRISLRGASSRREGVILDGGNRGELVRLTACSDVTIADLTIQNVQWNGIKINSETGVQKLTIHNCLLHNIWQRFIKGVKVPEKDREKLRPTGCRVQYCLLYNDRPKQYSDDPADNEQNFKGNYIGGIDAMYPRNWTISDNVFIGIHGRTREARGGVFLWHDVQNCTVERNIFIDCDSGICLGNSFRPEDIKIHCTGCIVRNNFVTRCPENGIYADYTNDCKILNNTVYDPQSKLGRLIRLCHDNAGMLVANNLVCGPPIRIESQSKILFRNNVEKDLSSLLIDPSQGNLHLSGRDFKAIAPAIELPEVRDDIDQKPRGTRPNVGAHQYQWSRD